MADFDSTKYDTVDKIEAAIKSIEIQGATNVAISTLEGMKVYLKSNSDPNVASIIKGVKEVGDRLAHARPNEPLAKNGVKYVLYQYNTKHNDSVDSVEKAEEVINKLCDDYLEVIRLGKQRIVEVGKENIKDVNEVMTHCHSSTAEKLIHGLSEGVNDYRVICTETRPRFQGRITAKNLLEMGLDTTMIVDSAVSSYIAGKGNIPVDVIFIGADEISVHGDAVNKVGSFGIALAAYYASKPIYVVTSILKMDADTAYEPIEIEIREAKELWEDAPEGLKMFNPAFDLIPHQFITGFITEIGLIKPENMVSALREEYGWVF